MKNKKITLKVSGMHCTGCSNSIERSLNRLQGISNSKADFQKGITTVEYDDKSITKEKIIASIENLGYNIEGEIS